MLYRKEKKKKVTRGDQQRPVGDQRPGNRWSLIGRMILKPGPGKMRILSELKEAVFAPKNQKRIPDSQMTRKLGSSQNSQDRDGCGAM